MLSSPIARQNGPDRQQAAISLYCCNLVAVTLWSSVWPQDGWREWVKIGLYSHSHCGPIDMWDCQKTFFAAILLWM